MSVLETARRDLVMANRILASEGILDAYGHVSIRHPAHPDRYILSRARAPELVEESDLVEFRLDGAPTSEVGASLYVERAIHGAVYEARPDILAVCHNHALSVIPFSISKEEKLRAVFHSASFLGEGVPVWDIAEDFGPGTQMQVQTMAQGRSLCRTLKNGRAALMRGHGSVVVGADLVECVAGCIWMEKNARVQLEARRLGAIIPLHPEEIAARQTLRFDSRAWDYWARRAGFRRPEAEVMDQERAPAISGGDAMLDRVFPQRA
jgi:ribulose-5-phosphate 4-epimerase/fuculose-1-phosphate aldolase